MAEHDTTTSSPGIAVRRTASLPLAYVRATQYSRAPVMEPKRRDVLDTRVRGYDGQVRVTRLPH
jgi:hypothetical protein